MNRQIWSGPDVNVFGSVSPDGRFLSYMDLRTKELALRELSTGEVRLLTNERGEAANGADPILTLLPADRRATLVARRTDKGDRPTYRFDIRLQGDGETVFFDI